MILVIVLFNFYVIVHLFYSTITKSNGMSTQNFQIHILYMTIEVILFEGCILQNHTMKMN